LKRHIKERKCPRVSEIGLQTYIKEIEILKEAEKRKRKSSFGKEAGDLVLGGI